ncbi:MAG TPA: hypothetical protein VGD37_32800 [Kofleriaceae bacterium]
MGQHRNPRPRLSKQHPADNATPDLDDLIHVLRDNLERADAFLTSAEELIERPLPEGDDDGSVARRRNHIAHLLEAAKLAVRAAVCTAEEIDRRRSGS